MTDIDPLLTWEEIHTRLEMIFQEGIPNRGYSIREMAAKTVFTMIYIGAIEKNDTWLRPDQVTKMTDEQAALDSNIDRANWLKSSMKPSKEPIEGRWYAQNTREPIRDETIRQGLALLGAVIEKTDLPTTSPKGRYALQLDFSQLFQPDLDGIKLQDRIKTWQANNLSAGALARVTLVRKAAVATTGGILTTFPNGETRRLASGPSSIISKAVVEDFAPNYLIKPAVLWLSESAAKEDRRDADLADALGLKIEVDKNLPDIILVDLGPKDPLIIFIEVVASDGPVNEVRKKKFLRLATAAGFKQDQIAFITAYKDREDPAFKKTFSVLAWQSFAWCMSEPEKIIGLHVIQQGQHLTDLIS